MMNKNKYDLAAIIGAVLLFVWAVCELISSITSGYPNALNVLYYLAVIAIGVGLLMRQTVVTLSGLGVVGIITLYRTVSTDGWQWALSNFLRLVAFVMLILVLAFRLAKTNSLLTEKLKKLWFLPGILFTVGYIPILTFWINYEYYEYSIKFILLDLLFCVCMFFVGYVVCMMPEAPVVAAAPIAPQAPPEPQAPAAPAQLTQDTITALRQYKELLDCGIISQEEFDERKRDMLGLMR